jgi:hypothetical protein
MAVDNKLFFVCVRERERERERDCVCVWEVDVGAEMVWVNRCGSRSCRLTSSSSALA